MDENATTSFSGASVGWGLLSVFRKLLSIAIFAVFPALTLQVSLWNVEKLQVDQKIQQERLKQERLLAKLSQADSEAGMVSRSILRSIKAIEAIKAAERPEKRREQISRLKKLFPGAFELYIFTQSGKIIPELSSDRYPRRALEKALSALISYKQTGKYERGDMGILQSILNMPTVLTAVKNSGTLVKLAERDREGFLVWNEPDGTASGSPSGFFAVLHPEKFRRGRALRGSISWVNRRLRRTKTGMIDFGTRPVKPFPRYLDRMGELRSSMLRAMSSYQRHFQGSYFHGSYFPRQRGGLILALSPFPHFFPSVFLLFIHAVTLAWLIWVPWRLFTKGESFGGRIPAKLTALFLFAIGTPSLVLLIGGYYAIKDHGYVLQQNLENRIRDKLREFDDRFPSEITQVETSVENIIKKARRLDNLEAQRKLFKKFESDEHIDSVYIIDPAGKASYIFDRYSTSNNDRQTKFMLAFGKELLARLNKSLKIDSGALLVEATEDLLTTLVGGGGGGSFDLELICRNMGRFMSLTLGAESSFVLFDALYNREGHASQALLALIHRGRFERKYISKYVKDLMRQPDISWSINAVGEAGFLGKVITTPENNEKIDRISKEVWATHSSARMILASGTTEEFWYACRGSNILHFVVIANSSFESVKERLNTLWMILLGIAGMVLVSSCFIGLLLSDQFLRPIADLTSGVKSIEARDFRFQIPIHGNDELGELSLLMNDVMEGMKDLQVARIVQESLFPAQPVAANGYRIWGKSRSMTDIGGDYFDYFLIGEDRILGLVGDVSGHGVSAALVMGMAKSTFANPDNAARGIKELLHSFNRFLLANVKSKKMMTLFLFTIDTIKHRLEFANAGHNFPILFRSRYGGVQLLEQPSFPLGIRRRAEYEVLNERMDPGDALLLYTDGLVEAVDAGGQAVGYERSKEWFLEVAHFNPHKVVDLLFGKFDSFTAGMPASDDISLICLKRET